jgi:hypothetical protein
MKVSQFLTALLVLGFSSLSFSATQCEIKVKKNLRAAPMKSVLVINSVDNNTATLAGFDFDVIVDGTITSLTILKPSTTSGIREEITTNLVTPAAGTPPAQLSLLLANGGHVSLSCRF